MKDTLRRYAAQQANAKSSAKTTPAPAPRRASTAAPAARHWGLPDPGHEYRMPAPAPETKQSGLDTKMVALIAHAISKSKGQST